MLKYLHVQFASGVDGCAVEKAGRAFAWSRRDGGASGGGQPTICERRALGVAFGHAVERYAGAVWLLEERAQAFCALGPGWGLGHDLQGPCRGQEEPQPDDRLDHRAGTPASGRGPQKGGSADPAPGRSRGGLSTKIHLLADGDGLPLAFQLTAGQAGEQPQALPLLQNRQAEAVIADRGYDADAILNSLAERGIRAVIPPRTLRKVQRSFDRTLYKTRNRIERCFAQLKQFRRLATRYCRLQCCFRGTVALACSSIHLKQYVDTP